MIMKKVLSACRNILAGLIATSLMPDLCDPDIYFSMSDSMVLVNTVNYKKADQ